MKPSCHQKIKEWCVKDDRTKLEVFIADHLLKTFKEHDLESAIDMILSCDLSSGAVKDMLEHGFTFALYNRFHEDIEPYKSYRLYRTDLDLVAYGALLPHYIAQYAYERTVDQLSRDIGFQEQEI